MTLGWLKETVILIIRLDFGNCSLIMYIGMVLLRALEVGTVALLLV